MRTLPRADREGRKYPQERLLPHRREGEGACPAHAMWGSAGHLLLWAVEGREQQFATGYTSITQGEGHALLGSEVALVGVGGSPLGQQPNRTFTGGFNCQPTPKPWKAAANQSGQLDLVDQWHGSE